MDKLNPDLVKLTMKWNDFSNKIEGLIIEGRKIYDKEKEVKTEVDYQKIKEDVKKWVTTAHEFLKKSFNKENNEYENSFYYARYSRYDLGNAKTLNQLIKEAFEDLGTKINDLWSTRRLLSVCESIIDSNEIKSKQRENYSIQDKASLLMSKLYELHDDLYYPIKDILIGNGIKFKSYDEDRELASLLEDNGFIQTTPSEDGLSAQLTISGAMHVEELRKVHNEDYNDITKSSDEINKKIDQIIQELHKQHLGQEIIYNELEELKDLYTKVSKKTWGQTLKGKLFDIGVSQALDKDVLQYIYEQLTNHQLRLP